MAIFGFIVGFLLGRYLLREDVKRYCKQKVDALMRCIKESKIRKSDLERKLRSPEISEDMTKYYNECIAEEDLIQEQRNWEIRNYNELVGAICSNK